MHIVEIVLGFEFEKLYGYRCSIDGLWRERSVVLKH